MAKSYNTEPYYDDFDATKGFHRILFRPGYAVQARELTQLQTILQNQISKFGDHVFKEGARVIPGEASVDTDVSYVKLEKTYGGVQTDTYIENFRGKHIVSSTSGVEAQVIWTSTSTSYDEPTLFVRYKKSGTDTITKVFQDGDVISIDDNTYTVQAIATNSTGNSSLCSIKDGVYYLKGCFVHVGADTIILDKYSNTPSYRIGLYVEESEITANEDESLFDNAQNSFNYAAPGAHRYTIRTTLMAIPETGLAKNWLSSKVFKAGDVIKNGNLYYKALNTGTTGTTAPVHTIGTTLNGTVSLEYFITYDSATDIDSDSNFIELIRVSGGLVKSQVDATDYSIIEREFARRTYDESGDYVVNGFGIDVREYRNNNRGAWVAGRQYLIGDIVTNAGHTYVAMSDGVSANSQPPVHTSGTKYDSTSGATGVKWEYNTNPVYNRGVYSPIDDNTVADLAYNKAMESKLAIGVESGKAYVQGWEIKKQSVTYLPVDKARVDLSVASDVVQPLIGNYVLVTNMNGTPPVEDYATVILSSRMTGTNRGVNPTRLIIPTANVNTTTEVITYTAHGLTAGAPVVYNNGGGLSIAGLVSGTTYYAVPQSVDTFKLATTQANATAGTPVTIDLTGTGNAAQYFVFGAIGTARVKFVEWNSGTQGSTGASYKLGLFDINMASGYDFNDDVKSVFYNPASNSSNVARLNFSADINPVLTPLVGTLYSGTVASPTSSTTIVGTSTSFQTDLSVGDYISVVNSSNTTVLLRVTSITAQNQITVDTAVTLTGSAYNRVTTTTNDPENNSLLFPIQQYAVKSVNPSTITYTVYKKFTGSVTLNGSVGQIQITTTTGTFASGDATENYLVIDTDASAGGAVIPWTKVTATGTGAIIEVSSALSGHTVSVIAAVIRKGTDTLTLKTKTLNAALETNGDVAAPTFTTQESAQKTEITLGHADGFRLIGVRMKTGTFASPGSSYSIDITDRYEFDDGQRDTHYDLARIKLKNSYTPPIAPIIVEYQYFQHSSGDYFSVNSYATCPFNYDAIPAYKTTALRNVLDFRPRIDDAGATFLESGGTITALIPKRGEYVSLAYNYYVPRKSKIALDQSGNLLAIDGVPSLNPSEPIEPSLGMVLYNLILEPYTFGTTASSVITTKVDNKRYTMRDIGKLEERINTLEYYSSLNLLEQKTSTLDVIDSAGDTRFKNGFIVDNFAGHNTGDAANPDYVCSIDMGTKELRPFATMQNVNLIEKAATSVAGASQARSAGKYQLYGDVITLPVLQDIPIIKQDFASRLENINPFAVFTFLGDVRINPSSDDWFEVDRKPDLIVNVEGNYNTIVNDLKAKGKLGTVWNAWQTLWYGKSTFESATLVSGNVYAFNYTYGGNHGGTSLKGSYTAREVYAQEVGQIRTGTKTTVTAQIDKQIVGDKVLSTAVIPYMRSRNVLVQIKKLKPNTRFYPFFDDVDISAYCTPATKIRYTPTAGQFDTETNVGNYSTNTARTIAGDTQVCLNRGDVITGAAGATAVVVGTEYNPDAADGYKYHLYVVNVKGSFVADETITGSTSLATGKFKEVVSAGTQGGTLTTNWRGDIQLLFNIPNNDSIRFRCGTREFKLVDINTAQGNFTSRARASYEATGIIETRQTTVNAVRNASVVEEQVVDTQVIIQTSERIVDGTGWYDPLAQTFLIEQKGGCFLSKIDVFFATMDDTIPVTLEIRDVINGYPGKSVLPFSRVTLYPSKDASKSQIKLSGNTVPLDDGTIVNSYDTPTTFTFSSPVYVKENTEYALVLSSDSNAYKVWVSQVGETMPGTARTISDQPYLGSLFKSQNASTWNAVQSQDLKFTIYRAQFDVTATSNVEYVNDQVPLQTLDSNPFETRSGVSKIRVWQDSHGMAEGSRVTISGVAAAVNGVPAADINTTHIITDVDLDSYCIGTTPTFSTNPTSSGYAGGNAVKATRNVLYDVMFPAVQLQTFPETAVSFLAKTTTGKSIDGAEVPYSLGNYTAVIANDNNYMDAPRLVASRINEINSSLGGLNSLGFSIGMTTSNDRLSPVIDTHRTSMILISNKINYPQESTTNVASLDDNVIVSNSANITIVGKTITTTDATTKAKFASLTVGKYLTIAGASAGTSTNLITAIASDGSSVTFATAPTAVTGNVTITQRELFVGENAAYDSSTYSKYVTKRVNLTNPSSYVRVNFAVNLPKTADIEVWYKTNTVGSNVPFDVVPYTQLTCDTPTITRSNPNSDTFIEVGYSTATAAFDAIQVKIVMKSKNSSAVPRIKDLRVVACA